MPNLNVSHQIFGLLTLTSGLLLVAPAVLQAISFTPPSTNSAPRQTTGGASRGTFIPPSSNSTPTRTTGGASRGTFIPPSSNSTPTRTTGGASRTTFTPPASNGAPKQTTGGSSRTNLYGAYPGENHPVLMQALLPSSFYGTTLSAHPTVLVYVPAAQSGAIVFALKDEAKNLIYQMTIPGSERAGIIAIQLPETAPALEVNKNYQWYVALKLDGNLSPNSPFVDGWIKRISPDASLSTALAGKSLLEQSSILATNGIWYDSAGLLATLKLEHSTDTEITREWQELLDSVQLSDLGVAPIVRVVRESQFQ